jgi:hypothetical protein
LLTLICLLEVLYLIKYYKVLETQDMDHIMEFGDFKDALI